MTARKAGNAVPVDVEIRHEVDAFVEALEIPGGATDITVIVGTPAHFSRDPGAVVMKIGLAGGPGRDSGPREYVFDLMAAELEPFAAAVNAAIATARREGIV